MSTPIIFQATTWNFDHEDFEDYKSYVVYICGTTIDGLKICVKVNDYKPFFYIKIPSSWNRSNVEYLIDLVKKRVVKRFGEKMVNDYIGYKILKKHRFTKFTDYKLYKFVKFEFNSLFCFRAFDSIFKKKITSYKGKDSYQLFESNLNPLLRLIHIRNLESTGWIQITKYNIIKDMSTCDIDIEIHWKSLNYYENNSIAELKIAAFDIECISPSGSFPVPKNKDDVINQIGTTFSKYNEKDCYYKHIVTLDKCNEIKGSVVECYDTEKKLLLGWAKMISKTNPDILTGYNIFGFDYYYIYKRAKILGILDTFNSYLSRIKGLKPTFEKINLSSAALGFNVLKYYDMPGRVQIDIMKVVQRDYKLPSYSLDNVSAEFIKEKVNYVIDDNRLLFKKKKYKYECEEEFINNLKDLIIKEDLRNTESSTIITNNTYGLEVDSYIQIFFNDSFSDNIFDNKKKYKILKLDTITVNDNKFNIIIVDKVISNSIYELLSEINENTKKKINTVFWAQAKDDIKHSEMYQMQMDKTEQGVINRTIIAKYCIKDCVLCNILFNKLEILNNNVAMANVTHVPLSFIFLKGQGIKIFSLVAKKCREENHLIPVIRPKERTEEDIIKAKDLEKLKNKLAREKQKNKNKDKDNYIKQTLNLNRDDNCDDDCFYEDDLNDFNNLNDISDIDNEDNSLINNLQKFNDKEIVNNNNNKIIKSKEFIKDKEIINKDNKKKNNIFSDNENSYLTSKNVIEGYEGATVLEPHSGIHTIPITVLDFASLYPSSMMEGNLSHETLVLDHEKYVNEKYSKIYRFYRIEYFNTDIQRTKNVCIFAIRKDKSKIGILPNILSGLINARNKTKVLMEQTNDQFKKKVLDGRQLALKITANSLYGQTGATTSPISQKLIAASTTAIGRERLMAAKRFSEQVFPLLIKPIVNEDRKLYKKRMNELLATNKCENIAMFPDNIIEDDKFNKPKNGYTNKKSFINNFYDKVRDIMVEKDIKPICIYGDSIVGNEPLILLDDNNNIIIKKIEDLGKIWKSYDGFKNSCYTNYFRDILNKLFGINKYDTYSDNINCDDLNAYTHLITGHKYKIKKLNELEILYDLSDESIIDNYFLSNSVYNYEYLGKLILLKQINKLPAIISQRIMNYPIIFKNNNIYDLRKFNLNLYVNGNIQNEIDKHIKIINLDNNNSKEYSLTNYKVWTDEGWSNINKVIRHYTNKKIYRIKTSKGIVDVTEDHSLLDKNKNIIKPNECDLNTELLHSFPTNLNIINNYNYLKFSSTSKVECQKYYINNFNKKIKLDYNNKDNKYILSIDDSLVESDKIESITDVTREYSEHHYVYDLETSNGRFNAGIGCITVKNTDSVFIKFNIKDLKTNKIMEDKTSLGISINLGILCSRIIGIILPKPQDLQYEKTFWPFIIITKKRYVGNLYEFSTDKFYQKSMGLSLKRRDYAPIVKIVVGKIVNCIINEMNNQKALECTENELSKIINGEYKLDKFIISKTLAAEYANRAAISHAVLADRIGERDPGNKPKPNDRIQYLYIIPDNLLNIKGKLKDKTPKLQSDRIESVDYVLENNLKIDYIFYINNQIKEPAIQFLNFIKKNSEQIFDKYINIELKKRTNTKFINDFIDYSNDLDNDSFIELNEDDNTNDKLLNLKYNKSIKLNKNINNKNIKTINKKKNKNKNKKIIELSNDDNGEILLG